MAPLRKEGLATQSHSRREQGAEPFAWRVDLASSVDSLWAISAEMSWTASLKFWARAHASGLLPWQSACSKSHTGRSMAKIFRKKSLLTSLLVAKCSALRLSLSTACGLLTGSRSLTISGEWGWAPQAANINAVRPWAFACRASERSNRALNPESGKSNLAAKTRGVSL